MSSLLADFYASFSSGTISDWDHLAEDVVCIGTDEAEWVVGRAAVISLLTAQLAEMSGAGIRVSAGDLVQSTHGDMVVCADRPTLHLPDGSTQTVRLSAAGRVVDGEVVLHQVHMSVPAANAEVVQMDLTTATA